MTGSGKRVLVSAMVVFTLAATESQPWARPRARFAYVANSNGTVRAFTLDATTGLPNPAGAVTAGAGTWSVAVDPGDQFVYAANQGSNNVSMFAINRTTGYPFRLGNFLAR